MPPLAMGMRAKISYPSSVDDLSMKETSASVVEPATALTLSRSAFGRGGGLGGWAAAGAVARGRVAGIRPAAAKRVSGVGSSVRVMFMGGLLCPRCFVLIDRGCQAAGRASIAGG